MCSGGRDISGEGQVFGSKNTWREISQTTDKCEEIFTPKILLHFIF